jgi:hypothetical protein
MPKPWIHLEMVINKKVEKGSKVITFKMVEEINQDNPVKVLNKEEIVLYDEILMFHEFGRFPYCANILFLQNSISIH